MGDQTTTQNATQENTVAMLTDTTFAEGIKEGYTFVDFWADWCTPCKMVAPTLDKLAEEWNGKIKFAKLNVDENIATATKFQIMSIPRFILFKDGQSVGEVSGAVPKQYFDKFLSENYAG